MNTAEKLLKAFEQFRPHINGHKTAMDLFFEGVKEVEDLQKQVKKLTLADVRLSLPTKDEIDKQIDDYSFRVPYDGSNNFYDEIALKHYKVGIEWLLKRIKGNEA